MDYVGIDQEWVGWLAGIFDGEGNIKFKKRRNCRSLLLVVQITNTDLSIIEKIKKLVRLGTIRLVKKGKSWKQCYVWTIGSREALWFLEKISPYLVGKNERVLLAIELQKRITKRTGMSFDGVARIKSRLSHGGAVRCSLLAGGRHISPKELEIRNNLNNKIQKLNRRGRTEEVLSE